ncbi:MAG: hypothetical protein F9K40_05765 [Kofleriaceae bacterium]|nr:MAG: hypothetical protein F9K40_05765 [Kofleriaceae bacterium]
MISVLVVHGDRKTQRMLGRAITSGFGPAVLCDDLETAMAAVNGRTYAVVTAELAAHPNLPALVAALRAGGGDLLLCGEIGPPEVAALLRAHAIDHVVTTDPIASADELPLTLRTLARPDGLDSRGVERYLGYDVHLTELSPESTHGRITVLSAIRDGLAAMGIAARHERHAALIADELLANAIHDAPHGPDPALRDSVRDVDRPLAGRDRPRLRWGADGRMLAIEVTDQFGSLDAATIRTHLAKLADRSTRPRQGNGGAGLGLAMAFLAATQLVFHLCPGRFTQAIGLIDLRSRPDGGRTLVPSLHIFTERGRAIDGC